MEYDGVIRVWTCSNSKFDKKMYDEYRKIFGSLMENNGSNTSDKPLGTNRLEYLDYLKLCVTHNSFDILHCA